MAYKRRKKSDKYYPEIHTYAGVSAGTDIGGGASVGLFFAWARNRKGGQASDDFVANGVNWTGYFYNTSFSLGSITGTYFISKSPFSGVRENTWSGFQISYAPTKFQMPNLKDVKALFDVPKTGLNASATYYFMLYGNGSDHLDNSLNVSGWHILNPIDPRDITE